MKTRLSWTPEMEETLVELRIQGDYTFSEIADMMTDEFGIEFTRDMTSSKFRGIHIVDEEDGFETEVDDEDVDDYVECSADDSGKFDFSKYDQGKLNDLTLARLSGPIARSSKPKKRALGTIHDMALSKLGLPTQVPVIQSPETKARERLFNDNAYRLNKEQSEIAQRKDILNALWNRYNNGKPKKILSLSDIHTPFAFIEGVEEAIINNMDADICILNGDMLDGQSFSNFDSTNELDIEEELEQAQAILDKLTEIFSEVLWIGGNHDRSRFQKYASKQLKPSLRPYGLRRLDPSLVLAEQYDNLIVIPNHWAEIGKCVFVHPDGYSSALLSTSLKQMANMNTWGSDLLPYKKFQALVQGHTHDMGSYIMNGIKVIEQGCLCRRDIKYKWERPSSRHWVQGYAVVYLDGEGNVDFNRTREYVLNP